MAVSVRHAGWNVLRASTLVVLLYCDTCTAMLARHAKAGTLEHTTTSVPTWRQDRELRHRLLSEKFREVLRQFYERRMAEFVDSSAATEAVGIREEM